MSREGDTVLLAEIFLTLGGILRDMGELKEAERAFRDAESVFRRNDHLEGYSRALNLLAGLFFRQKDFKNSLKFLLEAIEVTRKLGDKKKLAYMMGNLGRMFTFTGDLRKAEKHLTTNIELSHELGDGDEEANARLSLGYVQMLQGRYGEAEASLQAASLHLATSGRSRQEVIYQTYLGELRYRTGAVREAVEILTRALIQAEQMQPGTTLCARVMRHLAEAYVRLSDYRRAERSAARARAIFEKVDDNVELGALHKLMAQIAEARGRLQEAREFFVRALDTIDKTGVRVEKVEVLMAAGQSSSFTSRQQLTYLFRAEEYFSSSGLTARLHEVERLIQATNYRSPSQATDGRRDSERRDLQPEFVTASARLLKYKEQLPLLARSDIPILIVGETGVGKDQMARCFHAACRPDGPYVAVNCASVPETLLESELFGYRKGAFTGADADKEGRFAAANSGVLLLDEIGDMPLWLQAKLLGVLEHRRVTPLGTTHEIELDFKLVAATNCNLEAMVEAGTFRRDLYYRLSGITLRLPPLRERKADIPVLLEHFMRRFCILPEGSLVDPELVRIFVSYDWPGNVRELMNKVRRLEVMSELIAEGDLAELSRAIFPDKPTQTEDGGLFEQVERLERQLLTEALMASRGNKSEAARMLGIHEATVRTKLKRFGIRAEDYGPN
jgi:two-component system NtrC family response regulator